MSELLKPKLLTVGITGPAKSGKDTVGKLLLELLNDHENRVCVTSVAFATRLKQECARATGLPLDLFYDEKYKETLRPLMQWWGTEFKRNPALQGYQSYWVDAVRSFLEMRLRDLTGFQTPRSLIAVITDVRFDDEAEFCKETGFVLKVTPYNYKATLHHAHVSEQGVSPSLIDFYITNDHSQGLDDLRNSLKPIANSILNALGIDTVNNS